MMSEEIYRKLAQRLDTIPNGFSPTESGSELRLLAKLFTPEEAALASVMRMRREAAADIAARVGVDADVALRTLGEMARKRLIDARKKEGRYTFKLIPFVYGFY